MSDKIIELSTEQFKAANAQNAIGVFDGLSELIDELVCAADDSEAMELWEALKDRISSVNSRHASVIRFKRAE